MNVAKKVKNNLNQNLPRMLKVAENRKRCPKSQKLPKSCRATCGWAYCLDCFMINNCLQRYPIIDFRLKMQTHVNANLWLLIRSIRSLLDIIKTKKSNNSSSSKDKNFFWELSGSFTFCLNWVTCLTLEDLTVFLLYSSSL